jgi:hypothetical protein
VGVNSTKNVKITALRRAFLNSLRGHSMNVIRGSAKKQFLYYYSSAGAEYQRPWKESSVLSI